MVVLELTDEEAAKLEEEKNIVVEENILFTANTMGSSESVDEESGTEIATEVVLETSEEVISTESITEELTENVTEMIPGEITETTTAVVTEEMTETKTESKNSKQKKKNKKDKSKKDKGQKEEKERKLRNKKEKKNSEADQWNLDAIHYTNSNKSQDTIKVAVLDSGVSFDDDILVFERITINEKNEVDNELFDDATGHGTSMAGVIAAQDNEQGIKGINPNAEIYSIQILDENNQSTLGQVIAGIYKAIEMDCDIINMSFGTTVDSKLLHDAIKEADKNGILMIAAAGNTEGGNVEYPAAYDEVLAVGATDVTGNKLDGSSDGEEIEIFAPGDQVVSTGLFGGNVVLSGTSIAAAQVTGAASLLWSMDKEKSAGFIRSLMTNTAQVIDDNGMSDGGLLDIENAVAQYSTLEYTYVENHYEYEELQEEVREAEEFLDVKLVNGMWSKDSHASMAGNAASYYSVSSNNIKLMQEAARLADKKPYKEASMLHASGNYVSVLKFLYQCAGYLRIGKDIEQAIALADAETKISETNNGPSLITSVRTLIKTSILDNVSETSNNAKYYKVMGFAMHLTGDVYAHRTIVPKYTVKGTNPSTVKYSTNVTSADARFGTSDFKPKSSHERHSDATLKEWAADSFHLQGSICNRWNCFQRTVNLGVMEFKDIKNFTSEGENQDIYEDKSNFCKERYADAKLCCEVLFEESYEKYEFDGIYILCPTEENVKLNAFKTYAQKAGQDISWYDAEEWAEMSTPEKY